jgi:hypothetical protein
MKVLSILFVLLLPLVSLAQTHRVNELTTIWFHSVLSDSSVQTPVGTEYALPTADSDINQGKVESSELHSTECLTETNGGDNWANANTRATISIGDDKLHQTWSFAARCGLKDPVTAKANSMVRSHIDADLYYSGTSAMKRAKYTLHVQCSGDLDMTNSDEFFFSQKIQLDDSEVELTYAYGFFFLLGDVRAPDLVTMIPVNQIWFPDGNSKSWDIPIYVAAFRNVPYPCTFQVNNSPLWETKGLRLEKSGTGNRDLKKHGGMYLDFIQFD